MATAGSLARMARDASLLRILIHYLRLRKSLMARPFMTIGLGNGR
jgi:hypothetical protein